MRSAWLWLVAACHGGAAPPAAVELPTQSGGTTHVQAVPVGPWPDTDRATSADGSFALLYPRHVFPHLTRHGDVIELRSDVSEQGMREEDDRVYYRVSLARLRSGVFAALHDTIDATSLHDIFPDGTEASFHASPGFFEREKGGYHVSMGVEGVGTEIHVFLARDGRAFRFDCNYCCGMVEPPPKVSREDQVALCDAMLATFRGGETAHE